MGSLRVVKVLCGVVLGSATVFGVAVGISAEEPKLGWTEFLDAAGLTGDLADLPVLRSHRVFQVSSYDRTGGNDDNAYYIEKCDEGLVLADLRGPGAVLRIWSPEPQGELRFYIDGEPWPRFSWPFADVFAGRLVPFRPPLVGSRGGGFYSYLPVPYAESCRVVLAGHQDNIYYQVTACQFDTDADLVSFESDVLTPADRSYFREIRRVWSRPGRFGLSLDDCRLETRRRVIWPGAAMDLAALDGPGIIEGVWLELESRDTLCAENVSVEAYWDGETDPSVLAVVADLFGTRYIGSDFRSLPIGNRDGQMYCYFPMPFRTSGRIVLNNSTSEKVVVRGWVAWRPVQSLGENIGMFHAHTRTVDTEAGTPVTVLDARGRGQYVGCVLSACNRDTLGFLEGDDEIIVDGETVAGIHGTGTEGYFNGGWYFRGGPFATATHGVMVCGATGEGNCVTAYRFHLTDYVPFRQSIRMRFEHGAANNEPGTRYYTTAFWYQTEPHRPYRPMDMVERPTEPGQRLVHVAERRASVRERRARRAREAQAEQQRGPILELVPVPSEPAPEPGPGQ